MLARPRELSASLGPVPGKSNYSKRDRKLLRSRSSLSIYTVRSDRGAGVEMYGGASGTLPLLILAAATRGWLNTRSRLTSVSLILDPTPISPVCSSLSLVGDSGRARVCAGTLRFVDTKARRWNVKCRF